MLGMFQQDVVLPLPERERDKDTDGDKETETETLAFLSGFLSFFYFGFKDPRLG